MTTTLNLFVDALKEQIATPKADLERNIRAVLTEMVSKMDLVSQEEFERQQIALRQAHARLEQLAQQIAILEQRLTTQPKQ